MPCNNNRDKVLLGSSFLNPLIIIRTASGRLKLRPWFNFPFQHSSPSMTGARLPHVGVSSGSYYSFAVREAISNIPCRNLESPSLYGWASIPIVCLVFHVAVSVCSFTVLAHINTREGRSLCRSPHQDIDVRSTDTFTSGWRQGPVIRSSSNAPG